MKPPLRERRACLAKLVKNRLTLTQYQQAGWCRRLEEAGVVQSMSRKGNCIDNGATEQVFGHIKDEFFRGRTWPDFESFKADLDDFVVHWNTRRRQVKLKGLTPEEFRRQSLAA